MSALAQIGAHERTEARSDELRGHCDFCHVRAGERFYDLFWLCAGCVVDYRKRLREEVSATTNALARGMRK